MTLSPLDILSISIHWSLYLRLGFFRNTQSMHILCLSQLTVLFGHCMRTVLLSLPLRYSADERKCTHIMNSANISVLVALLKLLNMVFFLCVLRCKRAPDIGLINMVWVKWFNHYTYVLNHITKVLDYYYSSSRSAYFSWASSNRLQANLLLFAPPLKKLSLSSIVFFLLHDGGRCSKWKCLSSGTFNSLPVCLLMIFFCWAMCRIVGVLAIHTFQVEFGLTDRKAQICQADQDPNWRCATPGCRRVVGSSQLHNADCVRFCVFTYAISVDRSRIPTVASATDICWRACQGNLVVYSWCWVLGAIWRGV